MKRVHKIDQDLIDEICDHFDTHPNITIRELARMFRLDVDTVKHVLNSN